MNENTTPKTNKKITLPDELKDPAKELIDSIIDAGKEGVHESTLPQWLQKILIALLAFASAFAFFSLTSCSLLDDKQILLDDGEITIIFSDGEIIKVSGFPK